MACCAGRGHLSTAVPGLGAAFCGGAAPNHWAIGCPVGFQTQHRSLSSISNSSFSAASPHSGTFALPTVRGSSSPPAVISVLVTAGICFKEKLIYAHILLMGIAVRGCLRRCSVSSCSKKVDVSLFWVQPPAMYSDTYKVDIPLSLVLSEEEGCGMCFLAQGL